MSHKTKHFYEFGRFRLDAEGRLLLRGDEAVPLTPKALDLLLTLVEQHGHLLEKEELFKAVWPDSFVEESNLSSNIALIRKALGENGNGERYIETVPKRGYRFVAEVREVKEESAEQSATAPNDEKKKAPPELLSSQAKNYKKGILIALAVSLVMMAALAFGFHKFIKPALRKSADVEPRVVPFTSFPYNELDPSFSPDGNRIAFAWDGERGDNFDIYVKQIGTDAVARLTTSPAAERNPVWSPDGRYIAFSRVSKESGVGLFLMSSLGGPERKITDYNVTAESVLSLSFNLSPANWSPDGTWLSIADKSQAEESSSIFLVARETVEKRKLTAPPAGSTGDDFPAFSPDGKTLALVRNSGNISEIYLAPVAGGEARQLTHENAYAINPVWISEGREILFYLYRGSQGSFWKIPVTGGKPERIWTPSQTVRTFARSRQGQLAWSQLANDMNVWRIELAGSTTAKQSMTPLIASTRFDGSPQFSPDGQKIVFVSNRSGSTEIWVCASDGRSAMQLTSFDGPLVGSPRWSPDGRQIVFDARVAGNADLYIINAEGGKSRRLTTEESEDIVPSFSHDGKWIYFCSNHNGSQQIWKLPAAGGQAVQLTQQGGFDNEESSDGQYLYYAKGRGMPGIWRVPAAGGEEQLVFDQHRAGTWRYWAVAPQGIYFVTAETPERPLIEFFNFATNKIEPVVTLEKKIISRSSGLAISPNGRTLIWSQFDQEGSDIVLLETLR